MSFLQNSLQQDKGIPGAVKEVGLAAETSGPPARGALKPGSRGLLVRSDATRDEAFLLPVYE